MRPTHLAVAALLAGSAARAQQPECTTTTTTTCSGAAAPLAAPPRQAIADDEWIDPPAAPKLAPVPAPVSAPPAAASVRATLAPPPRDGFYLAASAGPSLALRGHGSGSLEKAPGGAVSIRAGGALRPWLVLVTGLDLVAFQDEASCGDCIYGAPGMAVALTVGARFYPTAGAWWLELAGGAALHVTDGRRSLGAAATASLGWELFRRGATSASLELKVAEVYLPGDDLDRNVVPIQLAFGVVR
jgi:hypothetical protein